MIDLSQTPEQIAKGLILEFSKVFYPRTWHLRRHLETNDFMQGNRYMKARQYANAQCSQSELWEFCLDFALKRNYAKLYRLVYLDLLIISL